MMPLVFMVGEGETFCDALNRGPIYAGPCCPWKTQALGCDMVALTCHCGEPCAYECGLCQRCGSHREWKAAKEAP